MLELIAAITEKTAERKESGRVRWSVESAVASKFASHIAILLKY